VLHDSAEVQVDAVEQRIDIDLDRVVRNRLTRTG
jgi:hypothetical protein